MNNEYLSIAEFAKIANTSKQAVYQRLNKSLKKYVKIIQGQKMLNYKALNEIYGKTIEQGFKGNIDNLEQGIIDVLKEQIIAKDKEIENLHKLLSQEQQLHARTQEKLYLLENNNINEKVIIKKWYQFWK